MLRPVAPAETRRRVAASVALMPLVIALLDRLLLELSLSSHLYCIPILVAAVRLGRAAGIATAGASFLLAHAGAGHFARLQAADAIHAVLFLGVALAAARVAELATHAQRLATADDLTGLHNIRSFEARAAEAILRASTRRQPVAMLDIDVDRLKQLKDEHGHLAGSDAVRSVGLTIDEMVPPSAIACRYGGDEFVVLLPGLDANGAARVAAELLGTWAGAGPRSRGGA